MTEIPNVKLIVSEVYTQINNLSNITVIDAISADLSYFVPGYEYNPAFRANRWDGQSHLLEKSLRFPSGLVKRVSAILASFNVEHTIVDAQKYPEPRVSTVEWLGPDLYDYQIDVVDKVLQTNRAMIKMATGSGKTFTIARIVGQHNLPTIIYTINLDLLSQMKETLEKALNARIGIVGNGICNIEKITICSVQTASLACDGLFNKKDLSEGTEIDKWTPNQQQKKEIFDLITNSKLIIFDEAHAAGSAGIQKILRYSHSACYRFGFTGTPVRNGEDQILLEAAFGELLCDISSSYLIDRGFLVPPKIFFRDVPPLPYKVPKNWGAVKKHYIIDNETRNSIIINNAVKLLEMGRKPLMLYKNLKHGERLQEMLPSDVRSRLASGQLGRDERDEIRQDFKAGKIDLLLGSVIYDVGLDLPQLSALILCGGEKSEIATIQRIGRAIRTDKENNKQDAIVVDLFDQCHYVSSHSVQRYDIYRMEPRFDIFTGKKMKEYLSRKG